MLDVVFFEANIGHVQVMIWMVVYVHGFFIDMHILGNVISDTMMSLLVVHAITLS